MLYPLKFKPIYKDKIWGGNRLKSELNKTGASDICGESWEISCVENEVSLVENGFLKGNNLQELIEVYMGDLVGEKVYEKFGDEFPLLIKYIDASDVLSVQVHPDDKLAKERHNAYGKTEMWYVIDAVSNSELISGFKRDITRKEYIEHYNSKTLNEILNYEKVKKGDVFFIPAGRIHAIGAGILLAEIQQTSDITYRVYDWDRVDDKGNPRELHNDLAIDAIDMKSYATYKTDYVIEKNKPSKVIHCEYFNTDIISFDEEIMKDYNLIDSFVIYMCIEGEFSIDHTEDSISITKGETVLIPADLKELRLKPKGKTKILEIYMS